jgi:hypothetical protein
MTGQRNSDLKLRLPEIRNEAPMDRASFDSAEPILDEIAALVDQVLDSDQLAGLRLALARLSEIVGPRYSVNLNVSVDVFDPDRSDALPLLTTGLSTSQGKPPYKTYGDSTPHRYVVEGEIQVVPHDRCPRCHGSWDFKLTHPSCSVCDAALGREVKLLIYTDVCPFCEEGKVSLNEPRCDRCGQRIDPGWVAWG